VPNIYTRLSCNLSNATELFLNLEVNLLFQEHFHLIFGIFAFDVQNSFGKKGANDIYSPPMSSISLHEEVQGETLEANAHTFKCFDVSMRMST
jgi:hypothetical protein